VQRQTGQTPPQLIPVDMPDCLYYLWLWFIELSNGRGYSEMGAQPLNYSEIKAWADLTHSDPTAWEISVIKSIDRTFLTEGMKK
jgi:hypothetical protein